MTIGAEGEWSGDWSRNSNLWTPELRQKYLDPLKQNEFFVTYEIFKSWFKGTMANLDQHDKAYKIHQTTVDSTNENDVFLDFELKADIDCSKNIFSIICEQQGKELNSYCWQSGVYKGGIEGGPRLQDI